MDCLSQQTQWMLGLWGRPASRGQPAHSHQALVHAPRAQLPGRARASPSSSFLSPLAKEEEEEKPTYQDLVNAAKPVQE